MIQVDHTRAPVQRAAGVIDRDLPARVIDGRYGRGRGTGAGMESNIDSIANIYL